MSKRPTSAPKGPPSWCKASAGRPGFTLIELIIYIALTAIVVVVLLRVMLTVMGTREKMETVSTVHQELRFSMDRITQSARNAVSVETGASVFGSSSGSLSLAMGDASVSPTVFSLSGGRIYMRAATGAALPLTSTNMIVDQLQFTNLTASGSSGTVKIQMHAVSAARTVAKESADEMTLETSVSLRQ